MVGGGGGKIQIMVMMIWQIVIIMITTLMKITIITITAIQTNGVACTKGADLPEVVVLPLAVGLDVAAGVHLQRCMRRGRG